MFKQCRPHTCNITFVTADSMQSHTILLSSDFPRNSIYSICISCNKIWHCSRHLIQSGVVTMQQDHIFWDNSELQKHEKNCREFLCHIFHWGFFVSREGLLEILFDQELHGACSAMRSIMLINPSRLFLSGLSFKFFLNESTCVN